MVRKPLVFWFILLLAWARAAPAQQGAGEDAGEEIRAIIEQQQIALVDLFRLADLTNPTLALVRGGVRAHAGRTRQAALHPNPTLEFEVEDISPDDPDDRTEKVALVQDLILSGRREAAVAAARAEEEAAAHEFDQARRDLHVQIHTLWAGQLYFREAEAAFAELLRDANHTLEIARTRFEARAAPEAQVTKALLEVYELEVARQRLVQQRAGGGAELSALFGGIRVPFDRLAGTLESADTPPDENLLTAGAEHHPAWQAARRGIAAAEASLREARAARIPDLELFVAYGRSRASDEGFVEAGMGMPLPIFDRNQGRVAETRATVAQARARARIVQGDLEVALAVARQSYLTTRDQLNASANLILPAAERGLIQAREGYRAGNLPILELVDAQRTLATVRLRTLELRKDLIVSGAELASLVRTDPGEERGKDQ
ncbi:MAG: TolC family protein [Gemmatimonadota bacterium]|jgi:cobalt-zinc-cadmium efflux system outer membrane protein|nr:TolC family protein [Gemmatimonadota bacterium]